jgi:transcriptional regulator with XRE-family HTH domain
MYENQNNLADTKLARLRKAAGLSQEALAEQANVSIRQIRAYEQHQRNINGCKVSTALKIANVLGCRPEDIME